MAITTNIQQENSIDALHSHCNLTYKASSFVGEEFLMNIVLMVPDMPSRMPWAMRFRKFVSL